MSERWVCKRCFADNDGTAAVCAACGLTRGAEASIDDQQAWAAQSGSDWTPRSEPPAWRRWIRYWWVPALLIALGIGWFTSARRDDDGSLSAAGTVAVDDLRVGDCFNTSDAAEISEVDGIPCDQPHDYEVFALTTHDAAAFPSEAELDAVFETSCAAAFAEYVGVPYADSELYASMITPSEGSWGDGDRDITCFLHDLEGRQLTGSMRGAGR